MWAHDTQGVLRADKSTALRKSNHLHNAVRMQAQFYIMNGVGIIVGERCKSVNRLRVKIYV